DRTILAGGVHGLKYKQQRPAILCVEHVLLFSKPLCPTGQELGCLGLFQLELTSGARIEVLEAKTFPRRDAERVNVLLDTIEDVLSRHGVTSLSWMLVWPKPLRKILLMERSHPGQQRRGSVILGSERGRVPCESAL